MSPRQWIGYAALAFCVAVPASSAVSAPPSATKAPTVSGDRRPGGTLTASTGKWKPSGTGYQWRWEKSTKTSSGFSAISGRTGAKWQKYPVQASVAGLYLRACVKAKAKTGGWSVWKCSAATRLVPPGPTKNPTATGAIRAGSKLTGSKGTWRAAKKYAYLWETSSDTRTWAAGTGSGRTTTSYTPSGDELGRQIRLRVVTSNAGGNSLPAYSTPLKPPTPQPTAAEQGVITESSGILQASPGSWGGGPALATTYAWFVGPSASGPWSPATGQGASTATYLPAPGDFGSWARVQVTATNAGGSGSLFSTPTYIPPVTTPPVTTALPSLSGTALVGQTLTGTQGSWSGDITGYTWAWLRCDTSGTSCVSTGDSGTTYPLRLADIGSTIRLVVTATGPGGSTVATSAASPVVLPLVPANEDLPTIAGTAQVGQTLSATAGTWSGPATAYTYQWQTDRGGGWENVVAATGATYVPQRDDIGAPLRVIVTAGNAAGSTPATSAATAVVIAPAPTATTAPAIVGTAAEGETLTADDGTWQDATSTTRMWLACDTAGANCASTGNTDATYPLDNMTVGVRFVLRVTATGPGGTTIASSPATATVTPAAPAVTIAPIISDAPMVGTSLATSPGSWSSAVALTFAYQWQESLTGTGSWTDVTGATTAAFMPGAAQAGMYLRTRVTASNVTGSTSSTSNVVGPTTAAPTGVAAPTVSGVVREGETLSATTGSWSAYPAPTYDYQWQRSSNGSTGWADIDGATTATYVIGGTPDRGAYFRIAIVATNIHGSATAYSAAVGPGQYTPIVDQIPSISGAATYGGTLTADPGTWSGEPAPTYAYQWEYSLDGSTGWTALLGETAATLELMDLNDLYVRVVVTASNDAGSVASASDPVGPVTYAPSPSNSPAYTAGDPATDGTPITATSGTWNAQPDSLTYGYQWQRSIDGVDGWADITDATTASYTPGSTDRSKYLRLAVTASNAVGSTTAYASTLGPVRYAPVNTLTPALNGTPAPGSFMTTSYGVWEGEPALAPGDVTAQWQSSPTAADGSWVNIDGATTDGYTPAQTLGGQYIRALITATNSVGSTSAGPDIVYMLTPGVDVAPTECATLTVGDSCTADGGTWIGAGPAGEPYGPTYQWERSTNSGESWTPIDGATSATYTPVFTDYSTVLRVAVTRGNDAGNHTVTTAGRIVFPANPDITGTGAVCATPQVGILCAGTAASFTSQGATALTYQWERSTDELNWDPIDGATALDYQPVEADYTAGFLRLATTAYNTMGGGNTTAYSPSAAVIPAAPVNTAVPETCADPMVGEPCTGTDGTWYSQGPELTYAYQWQRSLTGGEGSWEDVATTATYQPASEDYGYFLRLRVIATGDGGSTLAYSTLTGAVQPGIPTCPTPTIEGEILYVDWAQSAVGECTGEGLVTMNYEWQSSPDKSEGSWTTAAGTADVGTYSVPRQMAGTYLRVLIWGENANGLTSDPVASAPTEMVPPFSDYADPAPTITCGSEGAPPTVGVECTLNPMPTSFWGATSYEYEWFLDNGTISYGIPDTNSLTYTPTYEDRGKRLFANVIAKNANPGPFQPRSTARTAPIVVPTPVNTALPTVCATPQVGVLCEGGGGTWETMGTTTYGYTWQASAPASNPPWAPAGGSNLDAEDYMPVAADYGKPLRLLQWANNAGGMTFAYSVETAPVLPAPPTANGVPTITAGPTLRAGDTITASDGTWDYQGSVLATEYLWQVSSNGTDGWSEATGTGATTATYTLADADAGKYLRVGVEIQNEGGWSGFQYSDATAMVAPVSTGTPTVCANPMEGFACTASAGSFDGEASVARQWEMSNTGTGSWSNIAGATGLSYTPVASDVGKYLRVSETATNAGGTTTHSSAASIAVSAPVPVNTVAPTTSGTQSVGSVLSAMPGTWLNSPTSYAYLWQRSDDGLTWATATGSGATTNSYTVAVADQGDFLRVRVTATNSVGSTAAFSNAAAVDAVVGAADPLFAANVGTGADGFLQALAVQPDGKIIIGGRWFTAWNGQAVNGIVRLNADGSRDNTFSAGGPDDRVRTIAVQPDGKILVGGLFSTWGGTPAGGIVRLTSTGVLDTSFVSNTGSGTIGRVEGVALQADGKILVAGSFASFAGNDAYGLVRLASSGTPDGAFSTAFNAAVSGNNFRGVAIQPDGKIIVHGARNTTSDGATASVIRITSAGTLDGTFAQNVQAGDLMLFTSSVVIQPDGKIAATGETPSGSAPIVTRLNTNGTTDTAFTAPTITPTAGSYVHHMIAQPDGKLLVGSEGASWNGVSQNIVRLDTDGVRDSTFAPSACAGENIIVSRLGRSGSGLVIPTGTDFNTATVGCTPALYTAAIPAGTPVNTAAPTVSGTAQVGQTLTAAAGTWSPSADSVAYQWQRSLDGVSWWNITGASSSAYAVSAADARHMLRVQATPTNANGAGAPATSTWTGFVP